MAPKKIATYSAIRKRPQKKAAKTKKSKAAKAKPTNDSTLSVTNDDDLFSDDDAEDEGEDTRPSEYSDEEEEDPRKRTPGNTTPGKTTPGKTKTKNKDDAYTDKDAAAEDDADDEEDDAEEEEEQEAEVSKDRGKGKDKAKDTGEEDKILYDDTYWQKYREKMEGKKLPPKPPIDYANLDPKIKKSLREAKRLRKLLSKTPNAKIPAGAGLEVLEPYAWIALLEEEALRGKKYEGKPDPEILPDEPEPFADTMAMWDAGLGIDTPAGNLRKRKPDGMAKLPGKRSKSGTQANENLQCQDCRAHPAGGVCDVIRSNAMTWAVECSACNEKRAKNPDHMCVFGAKTMYKKYLKQDSETFDARACTNCEGTAHAVSCDIDLYLGIQCSACKAGQCSIVVEDEEIELQQRPCYFTKLIVPWFRRSCDFCKRITSKAQAPFNVRCSWLDDRKAWGKACERCKSASLTCLQDDFVIAYPDAVRPPDDWRPRTAGGDGWTVVNTASSWRRICASCKRDGAQCVVSLRRPDKACARCATMGIDCADYHSSRAFPIFSLAEVGYLDHGSRPYEACSECMEHGRDCDRQRPCDSCVRVGSSEDCDKIPAKAVGKNAPRRANLIRGRLVPPPGPLYYLALGYGPDGVGDVKYGRHLVDWIGPAAAVWHTNLWMPSKSGERWDVSTLRERFHPQGIPPFSSPGGALPSILPSSLTALHLLTAIRTTMPGLPPPAIYGSWAMQMDDLQRVRRAFDVRAVTSTQPYAQPKDQGKGANESRDPFIQPRYLHGTPPPDELDLEAEIRKQYSTAWRQRNLKGPELLDPPILLGHKLEPSARTVRAPEIAKVDGDEMVVDWEPDEKESAVDKPRRRSKAGVFHLQGPPDEVPVPQVEEVRVATGLLVPWYSAEDARWVLQDAQGEPWRGMILETQVFSWSVQQTHGPWRTWCVQNGNISPACPSVDALDHIPLRPKGQAHARRLVELCGDQSCGRPVEGTLLCEHNGHRAPVCDECAMRSKKLLFLPTNNPVLTEDIISLRAYLCAECNEELRQDPFALVNLRRMGVNTVFGQFVNKQVGNCRLPLPEGTNISFRKDILPLTGCACGTKMFQHRQCKAHRIRNAETTFRQAYLMRDWIVNRYGGMVCPACITFKPLDRVARTNRDAVPLGYYPSWVCLACTSWVMNAEINTEERDLVDGWRPWFESADATPVVFSSSDESATTVDSQVMYPDADEEAEEDEGQNPQGEGGQGGQGGGQGAAGDVMVTDALGIRHERGRR